MDIRSVGSRNIGATNVLRSVGKPWGIFTFALDVLKGFLPAFFFPGPAIAHGAPGSSEMLGLAFGCAAIAGHVWSVFLKFTGGKGVATSAGMLLGVAPLAALSGLAVWMVSFFATRYVSLSSMVAAVAAAIAAWLLYARESTLIPIVLSVLGVVIIYKHRANIQRLLAGTESRFGKK